MYNLAITKIAMDDTYLEGASATKTLEGGGGGVCGTGWERDAEKFGRWDTDV